jgi:hypothetical protein
MSTHDADRFKFLSLKVRSGLPLTDAEQREWDSGATWRDRLPLIAHKLRSGIALTDAERDYWGREAHLSDKVAAGLPLTPSEQDQWEQRNNAIVVLKSDGVIQVEAPPMDVAAWKAMVARSRGRTGPLVAPPEEPKSE